ncbi:MAG: hypothetical protein JW384_01245 [Nitrosomonadaceae bacterium]|nr:hypothetical protein [Nitrosomonadaceae bacterium]
MDAPTELEHHIRLEIFQQQGQQYPLNCTPAITMRPLYLVVPQLLLLLLLVLLLVIQPHRVVTSQMVLELMLLNPSHWTRLPSGHLRQQQAD